MWSADFNFQWMCTGLLKHLMQQGRSLQVSLKYQTTRPREPVLRKESWFFGGTTVHWCTMSICQTRLNTFRTFVPNTSRRVYCYLLLFFTYLKAILSMGTVFFPPSTKFCVRPHKVHEERSNIKTTNAGATPSRRWNSSTAFPWTVKVKDWKSTRWSHRVGKWASRWAGSKGSHWATSFSKAVWL